ncbi:hypothetical protein NC653_016013 [Populus alba x Populus x berolinensis]|uniref:Uncharacterized protein n=1 Tax=Populus alba x Populus x berolinensis TaxID=444605 RepID=A0AAD6QLT2_9ROSI|nr:hypothetical protein NC653_016013 [Populus alba x Populus x berolinensis]
MEGRRKGKTEPNKEERGRAKSRPNGGENGLKTESESAGNGRKGAAFPTTARPSSRCTRFC